MCRRFLLMDSVGKHQSLEAWPVLAREGLSRIPSRQPRRHPGAAPEVARQMTLVGKARRRRDFRQRKLGFAKHVLGSFQPPAQKVAVRRHSHCLVECPYEMMNRMPRHRSQQLQPDFLVQMRFDVLADPLRDYWRQSSTAGNERL